MSKPPIKRATITPRDREIGARIRLRRTELGITQDRLAAHLGLTFQQVQKYEKGANRVSGGKLEEIAKFLRVQVSYFFDIIDIGSGAKPLQFLAVTGAVDLGQAYAAIADPKVRRAILQLTEALAAALKK